jgi:hypothetical protein
LRVLVDMRLATVCLLTLALLAVGPQAAPAATAKRPPSACQKLVKRGKDRAPSRRLVVVMTGDDETGRISGCLLPRGKVRTLASWDDGLSRDWSSIVLIAGTFVIVEDGHGDQYGGVSRDLRRVDVRSGKRLALSGYGCQIDYAARACSSGTNAGEIGMTSSGAGAYELTDLATQTTSLQAFTPAGRFTKLTDGAVDDLRVTSAQITWTQYGLVFGSPTPV